MTTHEVVIVGCGPVGMMLAAELKRAGVDVVVLERRPNQDLAGSRAGGLLTRALELLDQRGVLERFLAAGRTHPACFFAAQELDLSDAPTRHPYILGLFQNRIERIMADWLAELEVPIRYDEEVTGLHQTDDGVTVALAADRTVTARYLVGCDGGASRIRKAAGIDFPGWEATTSSLIAEVQMTQEPPVGVRHDTSGVHGLTRLQDGVTVRVISTEPQLHVGGPPTLADLRAQLSSVYGTDFGVHSPTWISRFSDATRQAGAYRSGRVLLAGDALHIHHPNGGQGISLGLGDAVNLGWKLARVIHGTAPESLLDSYETERRPEVTRALRLTMAGAVLLSPEPRVGALKEMFTELTALDEPRRRLAAQLAGLDIHYDLGPGHPLLGRRMPDLDLITADGPMRVFTLLHPARPLLIHFAGTALAARPPGADQVPVLTARYGGDWELPAMGLVAAPRAVLVRPDGYVGWVDGAGTVSA